MSALRTSRGVPLPSFWQLLVLVAGSCAGWLVWTQLLGPAATTEPAPPSANTSLEKLQAIERITNRGPDAVPDLLELLSDADADTRRHALFGLGRIGPQAAEALVQIRERLTDEDPHVRSYAMTAFWQVSRNFEEAASVAAPLLADPDSRVREDAASFLETIGPRAIDPVTEMLGANFAPARILALQLLRMWEWDDEKPDVSEAVRSLEDDPDPAVQSEALATIVVCGKPTVSEIRALLHQNLPVVSRNGLNSIDSALAAISRRGPDAAELLPELLDLFGADASSKLHQMRWYHLRAALRALNGAAYPAVPGLLDRFEEFRSKRSDNQPLHLDILETLIDIGADAGEIAHILMSLFDDCPPWQCRDVAILLSTCNRSEAVRLGSRMLEARQKESNPQSRAVYTIEGLAFSGALEMSVLIQLIDDSNGFVAADAVAGLGGIGPAAAPAVPALVSRLTRRADTGLETGGRRRMMIADTLGKIGPSAQSAIPALIQMATEPKVERPYTGPPAPEYQMDPTGAPHYREAAILALGRIGAGNPKVLAPVQSHLADESPIVRIAAIRALPSLSEDSRDVVIELVNQLDHTEPSIRAHAALAIGRMNCDRSPAIPALISALSDENPYIRSAAALTLGKIGPAAKSAVPALQQQMLHEPGNWVRNSRYRPVGQRPLAVSLSVPELADLSIREAARSALSQIEE